MKGYISNYVNGLTMYFRLGLNGHILNLKSDPKLFYFQIFLYQI